MYKNIKTPGIFTYVLANIHTQIRIQSFPKLLLLKRMKHIPTKYSK